VFAVLQFRVAAIQHPDVFNHPAVVDLPVRRFDEAKLIDARKTGKTRN
jgi:hypothetical protein